MNVSSFFQGSALRLSLAGEGVSFDPATGELALSSEALRAGFTVLVTAEPADGGAAQSFRLRIAAEPADAAPVLLAPPSLLGAALVGAALEVVPGAWGGQPAPGIALQWLRDGVAIEGATGARYLPQAADDGREITCRVTAENASGSLSAEPAPVRVVRPAPVAVDVLADVSVEKGAAAVSVAAAEAFAGEGLGFAVTGAGATIDPVTGVLSLPTDVVRDGETVTVTASNSGGSAEASFLVSVTAPVVVPPALLAAPAIEGAVRIGVPLTVAAGLWSGLPLLSLQWLRDGAEIGGATAATYVPVHADDRCGLSCRVTATNSAGSVAVETAALVATYAPPAVVGELFEEILDQGTGPETVAAAAVFAGENLSFAVTGAGAAIDAATGVLTLSTDTALSGIVTVTASNSGGEARASFLLTVEAPEFPEILADHLWSVSEVRNAAPEGRRQAMIAPNAVVPAGFELGFYTGPADGLSNTAWRRVMQPGESFTTTSSMKVGAACYNRLFWRRVADGAWAEASNEILFPIAGLATTGGDTGGTGEIGGEAGQTLAAATQAVLKAALDARIATGSTGEWIIDLPNGNYGNINLDGRKMPGKTIIRSQNKALGAKFSGINMTDCRNIFFQLVDVDRTIGSGPTFSIVTMKNVHYCGIEYSRVYTGGIVANTSKPGWVRNVTYAIEVTGTGTNFATFNTVHMNLISGPCDKHIYVDAAEDNTISDNVSENCGSDFVMHGWGHRNKFLRNWGPRAYYPDFNTETGWAHNDFIQVYSLGAPSRDLVFRDNIIMFGPEGAQPLPRQGLFSSKSYGSGWDYEGNIVMTNSLHGITAGTWMENNRARNNTVLRGIDIPGEQRFVQFDVKGAVEMQYNVQCGVAGSTGMGSNGLNIPMKTGEYSASLSYYTAPYIASSFYDLRPVAGQVTHWAYGGPLPKQGAWSRFQDVIVKGIYPKIGPAATAWKTWYDPKNQITS